MILDKNTKNKPDITYPTKWGFKVIGKDKDRVQKAVKEILGNKKHSCKFSNVSKNGKFTSFSAECVVDSQEERDALYKLFGEHEDVDYTI
jgi:putative lipoic acid-binding regulatory protein